MKIALSGLHSQGKTTLLNELNKVDLFKHFTKIPSPTRILQSEGFKINENGDETTQACIMMQHLKNVLQSLLADIGKETISSILFLIIPHEELHF